MFCIDTFAASCKAAMASAPNPQAATAQLLEDALREHGPDAIIEALDAAIPPGASIGEMIVHASPELTLLYARAPARFQSGIHNHTVFANIAPLRGAEINITYVAAGDDLRETDRTTGTPGVVLQLPADVIHGIENPGEETAHALHLYGGDFHALQDARSLWDEDTHAQIGFSFPDLVQQSVRAMHNSGNQVGLDAIVAAIPAARPVVDAVRAT